MRKSTKFSHGIKDNITFEEISDYLKVKFTKKNHKTVVLFEDMVASKMFYSILGQELDEYIEIPEDVHISGQILIHLSSINVKCYKETLFIVDGDLKDRMPKKMPRKNLLNLPTDLSPEKELYFYLKQFKAADVFWTMCGSTYTKSVCFKNHANYINHQKLDIKFREEDKEKYKHWFKEQANHWGKDGEFIFSKWRADNRDKCYEFCQKVITALETIRAENLPQALKDKIYSKYTNTSTLEVADVIANADISEKNALPPKRSKRSPKAKIKNDEDDDLGIIQPGFDF